MCLPESELHYQAYLLVVHLHLYIHWYWWRHCSRQCPQSIHTLPSNTSHNMVPADNNNAHRVSLTSQLFLFCDHVFADVLHHQFGAIKGIRTGSLLLATDKRYWKERAFPVTRWALLYYINGIKVVRFFWLMLSRWNQEIVIRGDVCRISYVRKLTESPRFYHLERAIQALLKGCAFAWSATRKGEHAFLVIAPFVVGFQTEVVCNIIQRYETD